MKQINHVLLMLQQNGSHGIFSSKSTYLPKFTATYIINRLPSKTIDHKSPYEIIHKVPPDLTHLRVLEAMNKELQALEANHTWELVLLPPGKIPIGCKWVYGIMFHANSNIERFKARALLVLAIHHNWIIEQLDINNAFLHGDLHEEVYMTIPQGYSKKLPLNTVCKLTKSLYGLKQANRQCPKKNAHGLVMSRRKYSLELLKCGNVFNAKPISTPLDPIQSLNLTDGEPLPDPSLYRTLVGKLIYLTVTRPDISFATQLLSKFSQAPRTLHMKALKRVLRYIKLCPGQVTRRLVTGYAIFLGPCLISWSSKKQTVVSRSSTEAEYRALPDCTCELTWLKCLFKDLNLQVQNPIPIFCDNSSTISLASNPIQHDRTKHIEIDCHFVLNRSFSGVVRFIRGVDEVAYKMPHKIEQYDSLSDLEKEHTKSVYLRNEEDKRRGVEYVMSNILGFYKECLELGPEYLTGMDDEGEVTLIKKSASWEATQFTFPAIRSVMFDEEKLESS
ncbi:retrovirus-related pol polyprotein from transposon TNT 1-94 [Tanacetum coccineum]|uniref:Retrovirus-related pol polyprotein from transposon TNT 1-94 n=1 Tax=Tanacetum coccineum TaxID=301880 RepID=A0ABQ5FWR4_9ASTR